LWQIDLWRRRGLGLLAADFGPGFLAQDFAARHFLYRGDMDLEWAACAPDAERISAAFVRGINCYVELCESEPAAGRAAPTHSRSHDARIDRAIVSLIYGSLTPLWANGEYVPLLYSRAAVNEACASKIVLSPSAGADRWGQLTPFSAFAPDL
jgi:acyl-homoserine lactone acylase PvdQ